MAELKTKLTSASPLKFLETIEPEEKRRDSYALMELICDVTGESPKMWGSSIIGFGQYHYKSERSRQEGDWPMTGFSPRKQALTLYIMMAFDDNDDLLQKLGKHTRSKGCLYIKRLSDIDKEVLKKIIAVNHERMKKRYPN